MNQRLSSDEFMRVLGAQYRQDSSETRVWGKIKWRLRSKFPWLVESSFNSKPKMFTEDSENTSPYHTHTHIHTHTQTQESPGKLKEKKYTSDWAGNTYNSGRMKSEWARLGQDLKGLEERACWLERGWNKWQNNTLNRVRLAEDDETRYP